MNNFDLPNAMVDGLNAKAERSKLTVGHPLEASEKTYHGRLEQMDFAMLRKVQGMHAPLRLQMERNATRKVGHLPFLPRHNASYNVLIGKDETIDFDDFLGHPKDAETMGQPHAMVERQQRLL